MNAVAQSVSALPDIPIGHLIILTSLAGLGVAGYAIHVAYAVVRGRSEK